MAFDPQALNIVPAFILEDMRQERRPAALQKIREGIREAREQGVKRIGCTEAPAGIEDAVRGVR